MGILTDKIKISLFYLDKHIKIIKFLLEPQQFSVIKCIKLFVKNYVEKLIPNNSQ